MCVTNISKSRNVALSGSQGAVPRSPSLISQRLMGNFLPLMMKNAQVAKGLPGTVSRNVDVQGSVDATLLYREEQHPTINVPQEKKHPKRRRKPQKPGKTAKLNDRHFVVHNYHDHAWIPDESDCDDDSPRRGGVAVSFPARLHTVLDRVEREGWGHVISWQPHGRCFLIHKPHDFQEHVLPMYFGQNKLTSFQRQLNLYGFCRLTRGTDAGAYYHELFLQGKFFLTKRMLRTKIKGTKFKASSNPEQEPDFYSMAPVWQSGHQPVSDDSSFEGSRSSQGTLVLDSNQVFSNMSQTSLVSPTESSVIESLSLHVQRSPNVPTYDPYMQLMQSSGNVSQMLSNFDSNVGRAFESSTDDVLDRAVDELFTDAKRSKLTECNRCNDVAPVWDSTEFGQEAREDDLQLGSMLDWYLQD